MQRRGFLKLSCAAGIFGCLPAIEIRQGVSMELLQKCCDADDCRYDLESPFVENGMASATDGRIGVRVFDSLRIADPDNPKNIPPLDKAFSELWKPISSWQDWPQADYQPSKNNCCWLCNGRGFEGVLHSCDHCDGSGEILTGDHGDYSDVRMDACPKCCDGWLSDTPCKRCSGKPWRDELGGEQSLDDGLSISAGYHHLASQFPDVRFAVGEGYKIGWSKGPVVLFKFEGGQGLVMPLRKDQ